MIFEDGQKSSISTSLRVLKIFLMEVKSPSSHSLRGTVYTTGMFSLAQRKADGETHASFLDMQLVCAAAEGSSAKE